MISTLLIANRGEIALRVIRTARDMGIRTVAVYSDADRRAPHVRAADVAVRIGPTPATESYLSIPALLRAAADTGADAIHPGYGFLSERAEFARAVAEAGLVLVGPSAEVMERMGRKDHAREIAVAAGVPVVPSWEDPGRVDEFPVLVKAAAGGGGKGMRIVRDAAGLAEAIEGARREAMSAFGDDTILLEKYVERGRHVEVQVFGDTHGQVVHLFERDCSTQRRHQKVIEEAPAPTITAEQRELLTSSAVALAREVGYTGAGTVEFLLDEATGAAYFLEMNTRLQVEHPVTEEVVRVGGRRVDLVRLQLRIAAGQPLGFEQDEVALDGHAIEARVYAEDAFNGFLPQAGVAELAHWSPMTRNDVALESGQEVGSAYDPMIGKIIATGQDRESARRRLVEGIDDIAILGLTTNLGFVRALLDGQPFRDAAIDTAWLDRHPDAVAAPAAPEAAVFAAWAVADAEIGERAGDPFGTADGWRLSGPSSPATIPLVDGQEVVRWSVSWNRLTGPDGEVATRLLSRTTAGPGLRMLRLEIDGIAHEAAVRVRRRTVDVVYRGTTYSFGRPDATSPTAAGTDQGAVLAPMPGTVLALDVAVGDRVEAGQRLGVLEAMKMEHTLLAPYAGTVTKVGATAGAQVALHHLLVEVEADDE